MRKNFLFAALTVLLAGFWFGGASLADDVAQVGNTGYDSLQAAITAANDGQTVTLLKDIALTSDVTVDKSITLNLSGKTINTDSYRLNFSGNIESIITGNGTISGSLNAINIGSSNDAQPELTIENGTIVSGRYGIENYGNLIIKDATVTAAKIGIICRNSSSGTIYSGTFTNNENSYGALRIEAASVTIFGGNFSSKNKRSLEILGPSASLTIKDGTFTSLKNNIIFIDGTNLKGGNNITINSGTFITHGYASIVASNGDDVTLNGGEFINAGVGILARGGNIKIGENVKFNLGGYPTGDTCGAGKAGITVPCGNKVVMDIAAGYPGAATFTVENELGETYVIEGTKANHTGHTVKYGDNESEKTVKLEKFGTSAKIIKPTTTPTGKVWANSGSNTEFNFDSAIASDVELVLNDVIESIEITGVVDPVAGAEPFTGFTATTGVVLNSIWTGEDDADFDSFVAGSGYTLTIEISADTGYILSGNYTVTLNGESVTKTANKVSKTYKGKFKVTFDGENEALVESGGTVSAPTVSKECNSLDGWYNGEEKVTFPLTVTGNLALTSKWTYACSRSSGGGGGSSRTTTTSKDDTKANTGDTAKIDEQKVDETKPEEEKANEENKVGEKAPMTDAEAVSKFGQEQIDAYKWALENGITTMKTVEEARLDQPLTRAELAKMMVVYVAKVLEKQPVVTGDVNYQDVDANKLGDLAGYIKLAYQYQIMGINADGTPIDFFNPNGIVSRGEYATVFSRVLFGSLFNKEGEDFYTNHLKALEAAGILSNTEPTIQEMRGWVMLMMYRSSKNTDKIAEVISTLGASEQEAADAQSKAEEEKVAEAPEADATTGDVAEAPEADATTGDVAEAPEAEATTGDVAETPAEASTGDTASN